MCRTLDKIWSQKFYNTENSNTAKLAQGNTQVATDKEKIVEEEVEPLGAEVDELDDQEKWLEDQVKMEEWSRRVTKVKDMILSDGEEEEHGSNMEDVEHKGTVFVVLDELEATGNPGSVVTLQTVGPRMDPHSQVKHVVVVEDQVVQADVDEEEKPEVKSQPQGETLHVVAGEVEKMKAPGSEVTLSRVGPRMDPPCQEEYVAVVKDQGGNKEPVVDLLLKEFMSKGEDLMMLDKQHNMILSRTLDYNKQWTKEEVKRKIIDDPKEEDSTDMVVWGKVSITDDERSLLSLGPGYMVTAALDKEEMLVEQNVTMTKIRWSKMKTGTEGLTARQEEAELDDYTEEQMTLADALERESRDMLDKHEETLDMRKKRATDMHGNRRVIMPAPESARAEAEHSTRMMVWNKDVSDYRDQNCKEDGTQNNCNLSRSQALGLKTLTKKINKLEVVVLEADKGKKFVLVDEETYRNMAQDHIGGDMVVSKEEVRDSQRTCHPWQSLWLMCCLWGQHTPTETTPDASTTVAVMRRMSHA